MLHTTGQQLTSDIRQNDTDEKLHAATGSKSRGLACAMYRRSAKTRKQPHELFERVWGFTAFVLQP